MFELPTKITIGEKEYKIRNHGDFRMIFDVFDTLNDSELDEEYRIVTALVIFYDGMQSIEQVIAEFGETNINKAVEEMFKFVNCGENASPGASTKHILVSWKQDQQLIASAVNSVAKTEIRLLDYLHWWTFMGYYLAIGESPFATVVSIRDKLKSGKKLEDYEKKFRRDNPQHFVWDSKSVEQKQDEDFIRNLWNNGG